MLVTIRNCVICGQPMKCKTAAKKTCSDVCRTKLRRSKNIHYELVQE